VSPFTRALALPFIGRLMDFYIPRIPSNLENIHSVNTYMNVFYIPWFARLISYIYKSATSLHFKPRLLRWRLWLGFSQILEALFPKIIIHRDSQIEVLPYSQTSQVSGLLNFAQILVVLKQTANLRTETHSAIIFTYDQKVSEMHDIHQDVFKSVFLAARQNFPSWSSRISSRIRQIRPFEGVRFFQFPNNNDYWLASSYSFPKCMSFWLFLIHRYCYTPNISLCLDT
jgi:hypothetical protein